MDKYFIIIDLKNAEGSGIQSKVFESDSDYIFESVTNWIVGNEKSMRECLARGCTFDMTFVCDDYYNCDGFMSTRRETQNLFCDLNDFYETVQLTKVNWAHHFAASLKKRFQ